MLSLVKTSEMRPSLPIAVSSLHALRQVSDTL